jgi:hypothetical protein
MYESISAETFDTLDRINAIVAVNPDNPSVLNAINQLRSAARTVLASSDAVSDSYARSTARIVHDGLLSAAAICEKLRKV